MSKSKPSARVRTANSSAKTARRDPPALARDTSTFPTVSGRWLLSALAIALAAALFCGWATLCILFWQGGWQLLYHPTSAVTRTPASVNLQFDSIGFASNSSGEPQLRGWWVPAGSQARYTAIYLHGADGNLGDGITSLVRLHALGLNVLAFDYRGYGQSHFVHPSEARWREDTDSAIRYLTRTRHLAPGSVILVGRDLGANLALEVAAGHPELAGIVLENPLKSPTNAIFDDARARLVPAHLLVGDRWDTVSVASNVLIPSVWFYWPAGKNKSMEQAPDAYQRTPARKTLEWLTNSPSEPEQFNQAMTRWLDQLTTSR